MINRDGDLILQRVRYSASSGRDILYGVDLQFSDGEVLGILGPSGSGKTTLFRVISGVLRPTGGAILLNGNNMSRLPVYRRPISYMQQDFPLYRNLTILDNVLIAFESSALGKQHALQQAGYMLERLGIPAATWGRRPERLSGGELQRVALAKALLKPCRVLLLDEPMSNVDKSRKTEFGMLVRDLARSKSLLVLYISHDERELFLTADRIAIMEDGQMLQVGNYQEIVHAPVSGKVAAIGSAVGLQTLNRAEADALVSTSRFAESLGGDYSFVGWRAEAGTLNLTPADPGAEIVLNIVVERVLRFSSSSFVSFTAIVSGRRRWFWHVINSGPVEIDAIRGGTPMQLRLEKAELLWMDARGVVLRPKVDIERGGIVR